MPAKAKRPKARSVTKSVGKSASMSDSQSVSPLQRRIAALRDFALAYPEAAEDFPWGDRTIKVRGKIFLFLNENEGALALSVKLPFSGEEVLRLPFTRPTPYNLGQSGWVSAKMKPAELPLDVLKNWIDESYRAVASKTLAAKAPAPKG